MGSTTAKSSFARGAVQGLPYVLVIVPFGLLFGVVGAEAGLNIAQVMGFTVLVIAGAAQFTAVQLMTENAPVLLVLAASLTVNLRMAMYSASLVPHLGRAPLWKRALVAYVMVDQCYAPAIVEYETHPSMTVGAKVAFVLGVAAPIVPMWYLATFVGATLGATVPEAWALDFALPMTFIAMVGPLLRTLPHVSAAIVSAVLSLLLADLPPGVGLMLAAAIAVVVGASVETWQERRK
ncbi:Inner membrane protein YgaZ [Rhodobacteraceae bacterium THAF1]|uniref:AzlC family ABC transporter permease n=1 Tax=Palleronia sp. THAF1 TaxID=2587842 RepID=UPI000F3CDBCB|nr:AzlC family ABC transporter permease [Palleronia sp. THAF1]QFU09828.1 Inner membrane protein YgaZ [Palleronia sp. THAF1]VDC17269.1 Inner membrane protein YgaZ [Rhodobacteraceae bacterium THAF1]